MRNTPRICYCCGKEYYYCPHCKEDENKPAWMFVWDTLECKTVFNILTSYNSKDISKEEAKEKLTGTISNTIKFKDSIQNEINNILKDDKKKTSVKSNSDDKLNNSRRTKSL